MATWMPETCRWLPCNKITFIHSSTFVGLFESFIHLLNAWNVEHTKLMYPCLSSMYPSHYTDYFIIKNLNVSFWQPESWCCISSVYINTHTHTCSQNLIVIFCWCVLCFAVLKSNLHISGFSMGLQFTCYADLCPKVRAYPLQYL